MSKSLFVTCVSPERPHPSGRLAFSYEKQGVDTFTLFENARSLTDLIRDAKKLLAILRTRTYDAAWINVNGSIAQAIAVVLCRWHGVTTKLWIMDSYPGCLRYVTPHWIIFYPVFFIAAVIAKFFTHQVLVIDETFPGHAPTWPSFRQKCTYNPLPELVGANETFRKKTLDVNENMEPTIGVVGNIEERWLGEDFLHFYAMARAHGNRILIATSNPIDVSKFAADGIECVVPWPKSETDRVFNQCSAILVALSADRLIYSSPSKIIDCYMRGIQPVVMTDLMTWNDNKNRLIYKKCIHFTDYFANKSKYSPEELMAYSQHWSEPWIV
jgi:hypothetical protein